MVARHHCLCHDHNPLGASIYPMGGVAFSDRCDLHVGMLLSGGLGRPVFSMAHCRELPAQLRVANLDGMRGDNSRLAIDEDQELRTHIALRRSDMGSAGLGFQLYTAGAISP